MIIDERLERLTERHEALTQTVELMGRINDVITAINKDTENIRALAHIADRHEQRLTNIEEGRG